MKNMTLALLVGLCLACSSGCHCLKSFLWPGSMCHCGGGCEGGCDSGCDSCQAGGGGGSEGYVVDEGGHFQGGHGGGGDDCPGCRAGMLAKHRANSMMNGQGPIGPAGPPTGAVTYPYYTTRAPRDFLRNNPPSIGP